MLNDFSDRDTDNPPPMYPGMAWVVIGLLIAVAIYLASR